MDFCPKLNSYPVVRPITETLRVRLVVAVLALVTGGLFVTSTPAQAGTITIVDGGMALAGPDVFGDEFIQSQLASGHFTLDTSAASSGPDEIHIESGVVITWTSQFSLTLLAGADVLITGTVQHDGPGSGINAGAGGIRIDAGGDVQLGDGTQTVAIAVGSRHGVTEIEAQNVRLRAADSGSNRFSQIGYFGPHNTPPFTTTGSISVTAVNSITAIGGGSNVAPSNYVQVGNGGNNIDGEHSGNHTLYSETGDILFQGGEGLEAYAQAGNGGYQSIGNHSGHHTLYSAMGDILFQGGEGFEAYAQAGNGGFEADGTHEGNHTIQAPNGSVDFRGGPSQFSTYAQMGNGGHFAGGDKTGDQHIYAQNVTVQAGGGLGAYAQVGNGGYGMSGVLTGTSTISATQAVTVAGQSLYAYALVGNGGYQATGDKAGDHTVRSGTGDILVQAGGESYAFAQVGNGGYEASGDASGNHTVATQTGNVIFRGGAGNFSSYVLLGNGGDGANGDKTGDHTVHSGSGDILFQAGDGGEAFAQMGNGGYDTDNSAHSGNHSVRAENGDVTFHGGSGGRTYAQVGNGGTLSNGDQTGNHEVYAQNIFFQGGNDSWNYAQVGNGGRNTVGTLTGTMTISATQVISFAGGTGEEAYVQVGNGGGGPFASGNHSGNHGVYGQNVTFQGGSGERAYAQVGNGGYFMRGVLTGTSTISATQIISFAGGTGEGAYAQIGHGGYYSADDQAGDISIYASDSFSMRAGSHALAYAQIGHGTAIEGSPLTTLHLGERRGDILLAVGEDITLEGVRIGHYTFDGAESVLDANTTLVAGGNDPYPTGSGSIHASHTPTFTTIFNSAPVTNSGELRFYAPRKSNVDIAAATPMNGETYPGTVPDNRTVGFFLYPDGSYIDEYSFYFGLPSDLSVVKSVTPMGDLMPNQPLTYTLAFSNGGQIVAHQVVLTDTLPENLIYDLTVSSALDAGVVLIPTGSAPNLAWEIGGLAPGAGGEITISGRVTTTLSAPVGWFNTAGITGTGEVTFTNNITAVASSATPPIASLAPTATTVLEGDGEANLSIGLNVANPWQATVVNYATSDDTATSGSDYAAQSGAVTVPAGQTSVPITVSIISDAVAESTERFFVNLTASPAAALVSDTSAAVTILDDDSALSVTAVDADKAEGNSGGTPFVFEVARTGYLTAPVTVDYAVSSAQANAADFLGNALPAGTVSLAAGQASAILTATVQGDLTVEADETFVVTLDNPSANAQIVTGTAAGTIRNDDAATLTIDSASGLEGHSGTTPLTLTVTLNQAVDVPVAVDYATVNGSAQSPGDYQPASGTLSFTGGAGETRSIVVAVVGDALLEADENLTVQLSNVQAQGRAVTLENVSGQITIVNDDSALSVTAVDADKAEGNSGGTPFVFEVARTGYLTAPVTVDYAVSSAQANAADFVGNALPAGTVSLAAGQASAILTATVQGDLTVEADETFAVTLDNPSANAQIVTGAAAGTIRNDDAATLSIDSASGLEGHSGTTPLTLTVTLNQAVDVPVAVDYATVNGSAQSPGDYQATSGTLNFTSGAGETRSIVVAVVGDALLEADENLTVQLSNVQAQGRAVTLENVSGQITIVNDDSALSVTAVDADKAEGNSGSTPFAFEVARTGYLTAPVTVDYAVSSAQANAADFVGNALPAGTVTLAAGQASAQLVVNVQGDVLAETDEAFTVTLSNPSPNVQIVTGAAAGTIRNDDAGPVLAVEKTASVNLARVGETITYTYRITNAGAVDVASLSAVDDPLGPVTLDRSSLAVGEVALGQQVYTVQQSDLPGPLVNTVTVTGTSTAGDVTQVQATATVELVDVGFTFTKTVGIVGIQPECTTNATMQVPISTTVVYCFTVTNTGAETLNTHTLQDSQLGTVLDNVAYDLLPGATFSTTVTRTLYASVTNTAQWQAGYTAVAVAGAAEDVTTAGLHAVPVVAAAAATVNISGDADDQDSDGIPDNVEGAGDVDSDNIPNFLDLDSDGDDRPDAEECPTLPCRDSNNDGVPDFLDPSSPTNLPPAQQPDPTAEERLFLPRINRE